MASDAHGDPVAGSDANGPVDLPTSEDRVTQVGITTRTMWRAVAVVLATLAGLWAVSQARHFVSMLVVAMFIGLALVPGVNHLHRTRGWRRGAAVWFIYLVGLSALVLLTLVLIPAISRLALQVGQDGTRWLTDLDRWTSDTLRFHILSPQGATDAVVTTQEFLSRWSDKLVGAASDAVTKGISLVVSVATIATFAFYFAAEFPQLQRGLLSWFAPDRQQRLSWTIDQAVTQVGGYLYSRLLLTAINGIGFFVVMVVVGVPIGLAIPLAVFGGFISEFIPTIGTYLGAAIPIALTAAMQGIVAGFIVLGYAVVYQQIENYWLSPRISAKTMELNGGLAFGAVLAGAALFGPIGAFMALPVAALIVSFIKNYRQGYEVVFQSSFGADEPEPPSDPPGRRAGEPDVPPDA
jgi:predicted PurR-regulated permease PerM